MANYLLKYYCVDVGKEIVYDPIHRMSCTACQCFIGQNDMVSFPTKFRRLQDSELKDDLWKYRATSHSPIFVLDESPSTYGAMFETLGVSVCQQCTMPFCESCARRAVPPLTTLRNRDHDISQHLELDYRKASCSSCF